MYIRMAIIKKMNGNKLLITNNHVYELNNIILYYIIPVSYLTTYLNFRRFLTELPKFDIDEINIQLNEDRTVLAINEKDIEKIEKINKFI